MPVEWMTYSAGSGNFTIGNTSTASSSTFWGVSGNNYYAANTPIKMEPFEEDEPDEPALWDQI
jgi:hypothetical protein